MTVSIGAPAPDFSLPDTSGAGWSLSDGDAVPATVVVFTCNHCPYALAWHDRIAQVARDYAGRGVRMLAVNANDADRYPRDSLDAMRSRVAAEDWPMPYLRDDSQEVARSYDAKTKTMTYTGEGVGPDAKTKFTQKMVTTMKEDGTRVFTLYMKFDGAPEEKKFMEITYTKRK